MVTLLKGKPVDNLLCAQCFEELEQSPYIMHVILFLNWKLLQRCLYLHLWIVCSDVLIDTSTTSISYVVGFLEDFFFFHFSLT